MKHIHTFENFLNEGADESVNEGNNNWGTYNSPEGATVAKEINKAYDKLSSDVAKAFDAFKSTVRVYTTGAKKELGDKSGFNDTEGEAAMSFAIKQLIAKTFDIDARNAYHDAFWMYENELSESHYAFLGGNSNFTDEEMRKNVVDKVLGKNYDAYIMFDDSAPKGEYDKMHSKYAKDVSKWEQIWRSASGQSEARLSPDKKVVKATIFGKGGIIGAIYVKK